MSHKKHLDVQQISLLRNQGLTYNQIASKLGCVKSSITYYLGKGQKDKSKLRVKKNRAKAHPFIKKRENFLRPLRNRNIISNIKSSCYLQISNKVQDFQRGNYMNTNFTVQDLIDKFSKNPACYLTGKPLDINQPKTYEFDHIIPKSRGGSNELSNLGICSSNVNRAKGNMTKDEFIQMCAEVTNHNL